MLCSQPCTEAPRRSHQGARVRCGFQDAVARAPSPRLQQLQRGDGRGRRRGQGAPRGHPHGAPEPSWWSGLVQVGHAIWGTGPSPFAGHKCLNANVIDIGPRDSPLPTRQETGVTRGKYEYAGGPDSPVVEPVGTRFKDVWTQFTAERGGESNRQTVSPWATGPSTCSARAVVCRSRRCWRAAGGRRRARRGQRSSRRSTGLSPAPSAGRHFRRESARSPPTRLATAYMRFCTDFQRRAQAEAREVMQAQVNKGLY